MAELEATGQMEHTLVFISSDNGPEMETSRSRPIRRSAVPRAPLGRGVNAVPAIFTWPGLIAPDRATDGLFSQMDLFNTLLNLADADDASRPSLY